MPFEESWFTLKVSDSPLSKDHPVWISVPKKVVRLATRRNRLKRLIREAVRKDDFFARAGKRFYFRVTKFPGEIKLGSVQTAVRDLITQERT